MSTGRAFALVFLVALSFRGFFIYATKPYVLTNDATEVTAVARTLAFRAEFADPFPWPTGPTAHVAPVYPAFLSVIYSRFGDTTAAELIKEIASTFMCALLYALLPLRASAIGISLRAATIAGLIGAVSPFHLYLEIRGEWEAVWAAVALLLLVTDAVRFSELPSPSRWLAARRGAGWGAATLITPIIVLPMIAILIHDARLLRKKSGLNAVLTSLTFLVCAALVQIPWAMRNTVRLGAPTWIRGNFGLELMVSNHDLAKPVMEENLSSGLTDHPNQPREMLRRYQREGEAAVNRQALQTAVRWITANPVAFLRLSLLRAANYWFPPVKWPSKHTLGWLIPILGCVGLWRIKTISRAAFRVLLTLWLLYPSVYYIVHASPRYRYPIFWSFLLAAAVGLEWLHERVRAFRSVQLSLAPIKPATVLRRLATEVAERR